MDDEGLHVDVEHSESADEVVRAAEDQVDEGDQHEPTHRVRPFLEPRTLLRALIPRPQLLRRLSLSVFFLTGILVSAGQKKGNYRSVTEDEGEDFGWVTVHSGSRGGGLNVFCFVFPLPNDPIHFHCVQ